MQEQITKVDGTSGGSSLHSHLRSIVRPKVAEREAGHKRLFVSLAVAGFRTGWDIQDS